MKLIPFILILLAGCDHATQPTVDYFPPFQVEGEWTLYFYRSAWAPEGHIALLEIDQQQGRAIWGWFQPDTAIEYHVQVGGTTHPDSRAFGFAGSDWMFGWHYDFNCIMNASLKRFEGTMYVSPIGIVGTAPNGFYALRKDST